MLFLLSKDEEEEIVDDYEQNISNAKEEDIEDEDKCKDDAEEEDWAITNDFLGIKPRDFVQDLMKVMTKLTRIA